jgi:hypothetical protein
MTNIRINILKKGDSVLSINQDIVAVQRKNGEVDIFRFFFDENNLPRIEIDKKSTIGYGDGSITVILDDDGTEITTF